MIFRVLLFNFYYIGREIVVYSVKDRIIIGFDIVGFSIGSVKEVWGYIAEVLVV